MMEDIGHELKQAREKLGLTFEEAERATRIRVRHLQALERGELDALPSSVQARGFLKNYAEFLGLDAEAVLLDYAEALQKRSGRNRLGANLLGPDTRPTVRLRSRRPRWLTSDLFVAAAISLGVMVLLVWGGGRLISGMRQQTQNAAEQATAALSQGNGADSQDLTPSPSPIQTAIRADFVVTAPPPNVTAFPTLPPTNGGATGVNLRVLVERRTWIRVLADGQELFAGRPGPGEILEFQAEQRLELVTGNGAGVRAFYNGQDQGLLGGLGEVVVRLWDSTGALTPTPTDTLTPSVTPRATATPTSTP